MVSAMIGRSNTLCIMLLILASAEFARADYRGPVRFQPQTFRTIRPQTITQPTIPRASFRRENIRPATINQPRIQYSRIVLPTPPRSNFRFDGTIFGYVNEGTKRQQVPRHVPEHLRRATRRQPLGW